MEKLTPDDASDAWLKKFMLEASPETTTSVFRPAQSPSEWKAAETKQAFREVTEAAANQRQAAAAKLMVARNARDAEAGARVAHEPPKAKKGS